MRCELSGSPGAVCGVRAAGKCSVGDQSGVTACVRGRTRRLPMPGFTVEPCG